jgi:hypothetical protein
MNRQGDRNAKMKTKKKFLRNGIQRVVYTERKTAKTPSAPKEEGPVEK